MKIIGVTGGIGSGKSTVSSMFRQFGAEIIDADEISRNVAKKTGSAFFEVVENFGLEILLENGEIDRKKLGQIVFSDKNKLVVLNEIIHKYVFCEMEKRIKESKAEIIILDEFGYVPYDRTGSQLLFDYLSEIQKSLNSKMFVASKVLGKKE